ncbi:hypothetical protein D3C81_658500 [compost metagenome]
MTMPLTTPMPKDTAKIFCQKKNSSRHTVLRVRSQRHSTKASQLAVPMVKAGNSTWKLTTNPNWIRDNRSASTPASLHDLKTGSFWSGIREDRM